MNFFTFYKLNKKSILLKYFRSYALTILLPFVLIICLLYINISYYSNIQQSENESNISRQSFSTLQTLSKTCTDCFSMMTSIDSSLLFFNADFTNYSEREKADIIYNVKALAKSFAIQSNYISEINLYSLKNNFLVNQSSSKPFSNIPSVVPFDIYGANNPDYFTQFTDNYLIFNKILRNYDTPIGIISIYIDKNSLQTYFSGIFSQSSGLLFIEGKDGTVYFCSNPEIDFADPNFHINTTSYFSMQKETDSSDIWDFTLYMDNSHFLHFKIYMIILLCFIILIVLAIVMYISYKLAKKTYEPISDIMSILKNPDNYIYLDEYIKSKKYSELEYILPNIAKTLENQTKLKNELSYKLDELQNAKERALQAQINPHFIFNTLETVNLEILSITKCNNNVSKMICSLSSIMRYAFKSSGKLVSIHEELEYAKEYIFIQQLRYEQMFDTVWDIEDKVDNHLTIKLILQPIIENAIIHGIIKSDNHCTLKINAHTKDNKIVFSVTDNGVGIDSETLENLNYALENIEDIPNQNIGLLNVHQRIRIVFGTEYGCDVSCTNGKTVVSATIPVVE